MALRQQIPDQLATFEPPIYGVNLREAEVDLRPGEARLMQNCIWRGGVRTRLGSSRLTATSLGTNLRVRGGTKYYYGGNNPASQRLIAYGAKISSISGNGTETVLTSGMTSDKDTFFTTWTITDNCYIANHNDGLARYNGNTNTFATVSGTNIPGVSGNPAALMTAPLLDRLAAVTSNGVEITNPRVDSTWSLNSSWATFRCAPTGPITAIYPHTLTSVMGDLIPGLLVFQANAYSIITGTNFGADVTAASTPTGFDGQIQLIDYRVGTSSPYSVCAVPGVGVFWLTSDKYVYFLPFGRSTGYYVGDKVWSTGTTAGTESINASALNQAWIQYYERFLRIGFPTGSNTWCDTQYWLDMRRFMLDPSTPVWYGPMTGPTAGRAWTETQNGDNFIFYGEGNPNTGVFVYQADATAVYTDAVGTSDNAITAVYQTYFKDFQTPSHRKYLRNVEFDLAAFAGSPTCDVYDLEGAVVTNVPLTQVTR